ncbi:GtrA family protein [Amycolatopsis sp. NPDC051128]|uniref:GtrA family protein n=1 Tax=Amycolatopsis sp. NPDC051128 TaxID=3155412 RepID=UPI00343E8811
MRELLKKHRELLRFAVVGGISFVITMSLDYGLKFTVLRTHPVTALIVGVLVATIFSYVAALPQWVSRYVLDLQAPRLSPFGVEVADFVSGIVIGTLLGTAFRWWAFKKWVFPAETAQPGVVPAEAADDPDIHGSKAA